MPYLPPGSEALAEATVEVMSRHDLAVMRNHGLVTAAASLDLAIQNAVFFELACSVIVRGGPAVTPLPPAAVEELRAQRKKKDVKI